MSTIEGQTAIITGASGGVGSTTARLFATRGVNLVLVDIAAAPLTALADELRGTGVRAMAIAGDVTQMAMAEKAARTALDATGRIDILLNNAGAGSEQVPIVDIDIDLWRQDIEVNLTSQFLFCKAVIPSMIERGYGRVVNVASRAGMDGPKFSGGYAAAKAGVIAMTKVLGKELAGTGVIANALSPGMISTPMLDQPFMREDVKAGMLVQIPMGRFATKEEAANIIALMVDPSLTYTTGNVFDLSGGRGTY